MEGPERRKHERIAYRVPAHVLVGPAQTVFKGYVMNFSEPGLFVTIAERVELGKDVYVQFKIEPATICEGTGHVIRVSGFGPGIGIGIELTQRNQAYANYLANIVAASEAERTAYLQDIKRVLVQIL